MPRISVYESEPGVFSVDLKPDAVNAAQRRVTDEEYLELEVLKIHADRLQRLLKGYREERPEVEFEEAWAEESETFLVAFREEIGNE